MSEEVYGLRSMELQLSMARDTHDRLSAQLKNNREMLKIMANSAYEYGMSYERIAKNLGVSKRTVWLWLHPDWTPTKPVVEPEPEVAVE